MPLNIITELDDYSGMKSEYIRTPLISGMTCAKNGKAVCGKLFPDAAWMDYFQSEKDFTGNIKALKKADGHAPEIIFIQNNGVIIVGVGDADIRAAEKKVISVLEKFYKEQGIDTELTVGEKDCDYIYAAAPELRTLLDEYGTVMAVVSLPPFKIAGGMVFADSAESRLTCSRIPEDCKAELVSVSGKAVFCAAPDYAAAVELAENTRFEALVEQLSAACGGVNYLDPKDACRSSFCRKGRLYGKIAAVTGGAQGFGFGIARELAAEGATVAVADMNFGGAEQAAAKLCDEFGSDSAFALEVNISSEESVAKMYRDLVLKAGGLDLLVANAGVLRAGSVKDLAKKDWDFVTDINYSGYFLCVKYAAQVMAAQNKHGNGWTDIVQVNSKSGLVGSNRNGAYAGSKFGTIGLTQSFALELIDDRIKVNSVCPGNFFDGPLWSDPERGLFVQYLKSGKVPGARTLEDVKRFYESKIPMNRGCFPADVARAIIYAVEQQYETGQAIPVTGGQVMLN
ncbi:MAG: SDR family NAD(P)-dependent oxidoreductase [Victivallaceae bacterium]